MKTPHKILTAIAAALLSASAATAAPKRTLLILQENSSLPASVLEDLPAGSRTAAEAIVNQRHGELQFNWLAAGFYDNIVYLTDISCTRANLLDQLIIASNTGHVADVIILSHGRQNVLSLHGETLTGQMPRLTRLPNGSWQQSVDPGSIRSMLADARVRQGAGFNFRLRLVYMTGSFSATLNDDWMAVGAKTAVGIATYNWIPEPARTFFWNNLMYDEMRVAEAAVESLVATRPIWRGVPGYLTVQANGMTRLQETRHVVAGNGNLIFHDDYQLSVGQSKTVTVKALTRHNDAGVYLVAGQRYRYTATGTWKGGFFGPNDSANGHAANPDGRPIPGARSMRLCGERFGTRTHSRTINNTLFSIGADNTITAGGHGYLNLFANDNQGFLWDNSGSLEVTITRIQ